MTGFAIFLLIVVAYVVGMVLTAPRFARRQLDYHRAHYPSLWNSPVDKQRYRRESAAIGMMQSSVWPFILAAHALTSAITETAFADDLEAERELERAKVYARAKEIVRKADAEALRDFDRKLR